MKIFGFLFVLATPMLALAVEINPGDSLKSVISSLGMPNGQAQLGNKLVLFYDRGQVQLIDGRVTNLNFLSPEAFAAQQAQTAQAAQLRAQRVAEGEALKAKKLADPAFASAPPAYQLAFWEDFRQRYPEVSCDDEYNLALARQQEQEAAQENNQKIADLQARVASAEDRAAEAELEARQARYGGSYGWPVFYGNTHRNDRFRDRDHDHDGDNHAPKANAPITPPPFIPTAHSPAGPPPTPVAPMINNPAGPTPTPVAPMF